MAFARGVDWGPSQAGAERGERGVMAVDVMVDEAGKRGGRLRRRVCEREREEGVGGTIERKRASGSFIVEPRRCSE